MTPSPVYVWRCPKCLNRIKVFVQCSEVACTRHSGGPIRMVRDPDIEVAAYQDYFVV